MYLYILHSDIKLSFSRQTLYSSSPLSYFCFAFLNVLCTCMKIWIPHLFQMTCNPTPLVYSMGIQTAKNLPFQFNHIPHKILIAYNTPHQTKPITTQAYHSIDMYTTDQMIGMSYPSYFYARGTINSSLNILTRASPRNPLVRFSYRNAMSLNLHLITWYVTMCQLSFSLNVLNRWLELLLKYLEQVCSVLLQWFVML